MLDDLKHIDVLFTGLIVPLNGHLTEAVVAHGYFCSHLLNS